ncbi:DnaJ domain-containing protein [bacterium]|nr:DnaJ domain-containing protein [bacterium]
MKENIFSDYYIRKGSNTVGPIMLENIYQLLHKGNLDGSEEVSIDQKEWSHISTIIPDIQNFIDNYRYGIHVDSVLKKIDINTSFKVNTPFKIIMGPFNVQELFNTIQEGRIDKNFEIIINQDKIPYHMIENRLLKILEQLLIQEEQNKKEKAKENDFEGMEAVDTSMFIDLSEVQEQQIELKEVVRLSEEDSQGLLSTKPLLSLLFTYSLDSVTGVLTIERKQFEYKLKFSKGKLANIETTNPDLSIGNYLKTEKKTNIPNYILKEIKDDSVIPQLIGQGLIEPTKIYDILKDIVFFRLKDLLKLQNGKFSFQTASFTKADTNLSITLMDYLWKIVNNHIESDIIEEYISQVMGYVILKDERRYQYISYLKLGPTELKLANKINNQVTPFQFLKALEGKDSFKDIFKKLTYLLYQIKFVQKGELKETRDIDSEIKKYQKMLDEIDKDPNYFKILGVEESSPLSEIRKVYLKYARDYHPDKLNKEQNEKLRELKTSIYTWISTAYNKISTEEKLAAYKNQLSQGPELDAESLFKAEEIFSKAKNAVQTGQFETAQKFVLEALSLIPDTPEYLIYNSYLEYILKRDPSSFGKITSILEKGNFPDGYRFLGRMYKMSGDKNKSQESFKKLLTLLPYDVESKRELGVR